MTRLQIRRGGQAEEDVEEYSSPCRSPKAATSNKFGCKLGAVRVCAERQGGHPRHSARAYEMAVGGTEDIPTLSSQVGRITRPKSPTSCCRDCEALRGLVGLDARLIDLALRHTSSVQ